MGIKFLSSGLSHESHDVTPRHAQTGKPKKVGGLKRLFVLLGSYKCYVKVLRLCLHRDTVIKHEDEIRLGLLLTGEITEYK